MAPNGKATRRKLTPQIPPEAGTCSVSHRMNRRADTGYGLILVLAMACFYYDLDSRWQYVALAAMFPGGAFVGLGGFWLLGIPITLLLLGISLFLWFASGNIVAPVLTWFGLAFIMPILPQATRPKMNHSDVIVAAFSIASYLLIRLKMRNIRTAQMDRRQVRNQYLPRVLEEVEVVAAKVNESDNREVPEEILKFLRWQIDLGFQDMDDWSNFNVIDQFQTSAVRYQLNEGVYSLAFYNRFYVPSFRGSYVQEAQNRLLRKYCQEKVLKYWKYETLWGKLSTNYEPVLKDNIMLTGFYLLALETYRAATLDDSFTKEGSICLEIDKNHRYHHSSITLAKALIDNWRGSPYCLYACEPNWIYTFCNLYGINALTAYDANSGTTHVSQIADEFRKGFIEEFMDIDGSVVPIKSHLTGWVIPGLIGVVNELSCAALTACIMPDVSQRAYAIAKKEALGFDENGRMQVNGLQNADKMDPGRYGRSMVTFYAATLVAAKGFGDNKVAAEVQRMIDEDESLGRNEKNGVLNYDNISTLMKSQLLRGKLMFKDGWKRMVSEPMPDLLKNGPCLCDARYPEVLVAKARSHTGEDLELVLYPGTKKTTVSLGLNQLRPGKEYAINDTSLFQADSKGEAVIQVSLEGRTRVWIKQK